MIKKQGWKNGRGFKLLIFLVGVLILPSIMGAASFQVTAFSCTPSEVGINDVFSCTATVKNAGDSSGSVSTATLYTDTNDWLEDSNYPQASGVSVSAGNNVEITFSGLRAVKSGNNGFSKIMLDSVTDTYVVNNNKKVNVVNIAVVVSSSESSTAMGGTFDVEAQVTAGGNIDAILTFRVDSGGCSIGSQSATKSITGMTDGSKQTRTWSDVTQGTSGGCVYTITASATGTGGVGSKTDTDTDSVTCTNCPTDSGDSTTSGGGGGGAGGTASKEYLAGELGVGYSVDLGNNERVKFNILGVEYAIKVYNQTETHVTFYVENELFTLGVGDEIKVDLSGDGVDDVSISIKSINIPSAKVKFILNSLVVREEGSDGEETLLSPEEEGVEEGVSGSRIILIGIIVFVVLGIGAILYYLVKRKKEV